MCITIYYDIVFIVNYLILIILIIKSFITNLDNTATKYPYHFVIIETNYITAHCMISWLKLKIEIYDNCYGRDKWDNI